MRIRTLYDLGKAIKALDDGYSVSIRKSMSNTDRHIRGTRLRIPGRGRKGLKIEVLDPKKPWPRNEVFVYDTSQTYHDLRRGIKEAIEVFGPKLNPDPDLIPKGTPVRVMGKGLLLEGVVASRKMRSKTRAESYDVRLSRGGVLTFMPYELVPV